MEGALSATYELESEIGRGGMGIVYRARDKRLKRPVAIKLLPPELSFRRDVRSRFLREAETAAQLSHPNIVPIYSVDEVGNLVFFVMACIDGDNLARQVQLRGPLPVPEVRRWLLEVGEALAYAHARGVIHRDIKPDNILIDKIDGRALVTDFGIARAASDSGETARLTATGIALGTPAYMSPEQASGDRDLDARSDLYSLGIVAYQMLVGEPPFTGTATPALLVKHLAEAPVPVMHRRPDTPTDLAQIVMRLLEKAPEHRYQSATEFVQALRATDPTLASPSSYATGVPAPVPPFGGMPLGGSSRGANPLSGAPQAGASAAPYVAPAYTARTGVAPAASAPMAPSAIPALASDGYTPTLDEQDRWEAEPVRGFRKKFGTYLIVNAALVVVSVLSPTKDFFGLTALWTVYIAWMYAKLWSKGFDWHDVLRQPTDRMLGEVFSEFGEYVHATFSARRREELRAIGRPIRNPLQGVLSVRTPLFGTPAAGGSARGDRRGSAPAPRSLGDYEGASRSAKALGTEVQRLLERLPSDTRGSLRDVTRITSQVVADMQAATDDLAMLTPLLANDRAGQIDREITALEAEANPHDAVSSDARVRRLAQLRRDRRLVAEQFARRERRHAELETLRNQMESLRRTMDALRIGTGTIQEVRQQVDALAASEARTYSGGAADRGRSGSPS